MKRQGNQRVGVDEERHREDERRLGAHARDLEGGHHLRREGEHARRRDVRLARRGKNKTTRVVERPRASTSRDGGRSTPSSLPGDKDVNLTRVARARTSACAFESDPEEEHPAPKRENDGSRPRFVRRAELYATSARDTAHLNVRYPWEYSRWRSSPARQAHRAQTRGDRTAINRGHYTLENGRDGCEDAGGSRAARTRRRELHADGWMVVLHEWFATARRRDAPDDSAHPAAMEIQWRAQSVFA